MIANFQAFASQNASDRRGFTTGRGALIPPGWSTRIRSTINKSCFACAIWRDFVQILGLDASLKFIFKQAKCSRLETYKAAITFCHDFGAMLVPSRISVLFSWRGQWAVKELKLVTGTFGIDETDGQMFCESCCPRLLFFPVPLVYDFRQTKGASKAHESVSEASGRIIRNSTRTFLEFKLEKSG